MTADPALHAAAVALIEQRLPDAAWATAAALRLDDGTVLVGIGLDNFNAGAGLCAEAGPIAQAFTAGRAVTASVCVNRSRERGGDVVLAPCGLCQERLALWGPEVQVGVADAADPRGWSSRRLAELNPYYWATALLDHDGWPTAEDHAD